jgi:hypothetical protein
MHLFHHIVVFSPSEQEKRAFVEAGVEFTRTVSAGSKKPQSKHNGHAEERYCGILWN